MDLNKRLREHTGLTPTDQCLRDYFLRYPERAARMNTRQLAEATFTSPSAVVRFCRKFGYQGLQDFKGAYFSAIPDAPAFDLPDGDFPFQADTPPDVLVRTCSNWRKAPSTAWPPPWTRPPSTGRPPC